MSELVSSVICNILLVCFCLSTLAWTAVGIQTFVNDGRERKRRQEQNKRDLEYHEARMKEFNR